MNETVEGVKVVIAPALAILAGMMVLLMDLGARGSAARRMIPAVSGGGLILAALAAWIQGTALVGVSAPAFGGGVVIDSLSGILSVVLCGVAGGALAMGADYLEERGLPKGEFHALVLFSTSGAMLMAQSMDLVNLFVGLEVLSVSLYILAGYARKDKRSEESAVKYFLLGAFASGFLLYGIALIYGAVGLKTRDMGYTTIIDSYTNLQTISSLLTHSADTGHPLAASPLFAAGVALLFVGLAFKAALVPFHNYAPDVYEGAPAPVTAFMSAAAKIGAFAALLRLVQLAVGQHGPLTHVMWGIALATMVIGNVQAIRQTNLKRMLAFSSVAHAGYLLVGVLASSTATASAFATESVRFYLLAYALMNLGAFAVVLWLGINGNERAELSEYRGLARRQPAAAAVLTIFLLSLSGIPLTVGFLGKLYLFLAAVDAGFTGLAVAGLLASVIGVFYYLNVIVTMYFQAPNDQMPAVREGGARVVAVACAIAVVVLGLLPIAGITPVRTPPTAAAATAAAPSPSLPRVGS